MLRTPTRVARAGLALVVVTAVGLAGCTPEDREQISQEASGAGQQLRDAASEAERELSSIEPPEPESEAPPTEAPATEAQAEPSPEVTDEPDTEEAMQTQDWLPIVLGLLALLVIVLLVSSFLGRRRDARRAAHDRVRDAIGDLLGTGRWVLDQGSVEVQRITDPQQLQRSWQMVRERLVGLEERVAGLMVDVEGEPVANVLQNLAVSSEALRSVLDGTVSLRGDAAPDPDLVSDNRLAVQQRRRDFGAALDRLATFR